LENKTTKTCPDFFVVNNKKVIDKTEIAELFNNYFVNIGRKKNVQSKIPKQNETFENYISHNISNNMFITSTDPINIIDTAKTLKRKPRSGFDEISTKLLSEIIEDIAYPLTYIINVSFSKGVVPENMNNPRSYLSINLVKYLNLTITDQSVYCLHSLNY